MCVRERERRSMRGKTKEIDRGWLPREQILGERREKETGTGKQRDILGEANE